MIWYVVISHIVLAILLFFLVNWLGSRSEPLGYMQLSIGMQDDTAPTFNYLFKVLAPVVFIILMAALFQVLNLPAFNKNIYLVVVYYWAFRLLYVILLGHASLLDWKVQILYWVSSIGLAVWVYSLIDKLETILPSSQSLIEELWLLIILFIYTIINKLQFFRGETEERKKRYIDRQYTKFHNRFGNQVDEYFDNDLLRALTFSIMIYENYNRSDFARFLERLLLKNSKKKHTYGIMQVMSNHVLSDEESIELGMKKIEQDYKRIISEEEECSVELSSWIVFQVANAYNGGDEHYSDEVRDVFTRLNERFYTDIPSEIVISEDL